MDNLDHTFDSRLREEFGQLDVRINEAHWNRLDAALSATPSPSFFKKHKRIIVLLFLLLIASAVLLIIYSPGTGSGKPFSPSINKLTTPAQNRKDGKAKWLQTDKLAAGTQTSAGKQKVNPSGNEQPVLFTPPLLSVDSIAAADSIAAKRKADSVQLLKKKKKIHLIW